MESCHKCIKLRLTVIIQSIICHSKPSSSLLLKIIKSWLDTHNGNVCTDEDAHSLLPAPVWQDILKRHLKPQHASPGACIYHAHNFKANQNKKWCFHCGEFKWLNFSLKRWIIVNAKVLYDSDFSFGKTASTRKTLGFKFSTCIFLQNWIGFELNKAFTGNVLIMFDWQSFLEFL